ncbi:M20/M25/M40 family metallo-hydrolase [Candidatus Nitrosacidococcus sp. I8]|uniref:M20/M25/M40 family metallo-hydrolase n=1 Tax=Candidatus Nitrosacidococcus sp. I8 TaxID=2942908 RepID=UPI002225D5CB|nr:M20/M25/M40 family metallo-hydrolase [Candidatus Nitrosacidococcus sp. I8]CAH9017546.1 hypothetical protein NURINAE_00432 [Candidatus Nitrosacidococcus sp. I8]
MKLYQKIFINLLFLVISPLLQAEEIHHQLEIYLDPDSHHLKAIDTITLPDSYPSPITFRLHNHLNPQLESPEIQLKKLKESEFTEDYILTFPKGVHEFTINYEGEIFHSIKPISQEYAHSFSASSGLIASEGVFLTGGSYWYPQFANDGLITFSLTTHLPQKWHSVSQGIRTQQNDQEIWKENHPQEEIYLIAGQFTEYDGKAENGKVTTMAFLQHPDPGLAHKYLEATNQYLEIYRSLISSYPYGKFALVENFWETGYGMPSFTLLGTNVIRFPFILHSSYPHEILHNWWGNGVYLKYGSGNWTEGLTAYLADHLLKEQQGEGVTYRRETLQKYTDYVEESRDFPLTQFRGRDSAASQAIGYGKTLMMFHMLRQKLGDKTFIKALQNFYHQYQYAPAGFSDLEGSFEKTSGQSLHSFFNQWITRPGAPLLKIKSAQVTPKEGKYILTATIAQVQGGKPYQLAIPTAIYLENSEQVYQTQIEFDKKEHRIELTFSNRPLKFEIDPQFDVFRRLDSNEIPPALSQAFGAKTALAILPASASSALKEGYQHLIETWQQEGRNIKVVMDNTIDKLPSDQMVWLLGWENKFRSVFHRSLEGYPYQANVDSVKIKNHMLNKTHHSVIVTTRPENNLHQTLVWIATDNVAALPGLTRKLPHYGKYSYLGFAGSEPENITKGQWSVIRSPMSVLFTQDSSAIKSTLPLQKSLISLSSQFNQDQMMADIQYLADPKQEGRGLGSSGLEQVAKYIENAFQEAGFNPIEQKWIEHIPQAAKEMALSNIIGTLSGTDPSLPTIVIGAHYDHLGKGWPDMHQGDEGKIHPGADDNASGVAVILEMARSLGTGWQGKRTLTFIAFTGEEAGKLGSTYYVNHLTQPVMTMINLDTVGRLNKNKLLILGTHSAKEWSYIFQGASYVTGVPIEIVTQDLDSSDHNSFINVGIPAVQLFTGAHRDYHRPTDTIDKIDSLGLTKVAAVLKEAIDYLANRNESLAGENTIQPTLPLTKSSRKVTLGTVPDFSWKGEGVRLSGVS